MEELRVMLLNNELEREFLTEEDYSDLIDNEMSLPEPLNEVIDYCIDGLSEFEEYQETVEKINIDIEALIRQVDEEQKAKQCAGKRKKSKKMLFVAAAAVVAIFSAQLVSVVMGYSNVIDLIRNAINTPEKKVMYNNDKHMIFTDNTRFYDSMNEMLETENLSILYPTKLPNGYEFTEFMIADTGDYIELRAYAVDPYISFAVEFGVDFQIDNYDYEINDIEYNIVETANGMYKAEWIDGSDSYGIIVGEKATLSKIIENFEEYKK